ncbi:MAG: nicotinate-nucleotide--dimethylbenzimidazole phosphoribosyltransferase [Nitrospirae bacterium]|nr:nicotinate-nucleotide--dimethylbenzimidazole phosphoribosyltransferase [Nitrospirota bacterium]
MLLREIIDRIQAADPRLLAQAQARLDRLTKPIGSLGRLEELAARYVMITGEMKPQIPRGAVFTFAADHGVTTEGVSAYPSAVTPQMVLNFLRGGAAVNVLARHAGIEVRVVDIGVNYDFDTAPGLIHKKVMPGTKNLLVESAMSPAQAEQALQVGIELATEAAQQGIGLIGTGEMGIGNTTASSAITAVLTGRPVSEVTGRGTGISDASHAHKIEVIQRALALHRLDRADVMQVLATVGGLEIAGLAGLILGAAAARIPVVLDGFIAGAAALIAVGLQPRCKDYLIASHRSVERGHQAILDHLGVKPLFDLDLRLGEGTGACLGMSLVFAAIKILTEMATFDEAGVSERTVEGGKGIKG